MVRTNLVSLGFCKPDRRISSLHLWSERRTKLALAKRRRLLEQKQNRWLTKQNASTMRTTLLARKISCYIYSEHTFPRKNVLTYLMIVLWVSLTLKAGTENMRGGSLLKSLSTFIQTNSKLNLRRNTSRCRKLAALLTNSLTSSKVLESEQVSNKEMISLLHFYLNSIMT